MASLLVKRVDESLMREMNAAAARQGQTLRAWVIWVLQANVKADTAVPESAAVATGRLSIDQLRALEAQTKAATISLEEPEPESFDCPNPDCGQALVLMERGPNLGKYACSACDKGWSVAQLRSARSARNGRR